MRCRRSANGPCLSSRRNRSSTPMKRFSQETQMKAALNTLTVMTVIAMAAGCASTKYYKVTDATTGKPYYTQEIAKNANAIQFKDAKTGAATTLQNSQVLEIDKAAYSAGLTAAAAPVTSAPAAAPAAAAPAPATPAPPPPPPAPRPPAAAVATPVAAPAAPAAAAPLAPASPTPVSGPAQAAP